MSEGFVAMTRESLDDVRRPEETPDKIGTQGDRRPNGPIDQDTRHAVVFLSYNMAHKAIPG